MKLGNQTYTEEKVKVRNMNIAELKVGMFKLMHKRQLEHEKIRILDMYEGTVDDFKSVTEFLLNNWDNDCKLKLYSVSLIEKKLENAVEKYVLVKMESKESE